MGFENKNFNEPIYVEANLEPARVIIISCEGRNTEPEYFNTIKTKLTEYIPTLIEIHIVPKNDNNTEPKDIVCNLDEFIKDTYDYKSDYDEMWVIWDREKIEQRKKQILEILPECKKKNYNIAMSNPAFEFWLLLHIVDITTYNYIKLHNNEWTTDSRNKRFLDKELSDKLKSGFNKKKNRFNKDIVSKENILRALEQEKLFENDLENMIDNLGSNIGNLINKILDI